MLHCILDNPISHTVYSAHIRLTIAPPSILERGAILIPPPSNPHTPSPYSARTPAPVRSGSSSPPQTPDSACKTPLGCPLSWFAVCRCACLCSWRCHAAFYSGADDRKLQFRKHCAHLHECKRCGLTVLSLFSTI